MPRPIAPPPEAQAQLSLDEAISLLSGRDYWHTQPLKRLRLPALTLTDGPHGVRLQESDPSKADLGAALPSTCYPTASALAASWNVDLLRRVGDMLGREARALGVDVLLGPGLNIKRSPLCGRNFEYFSEDPLLSGKLASAWVQGVQGQGVGACLKHFAANNQETRRMSVSSVVDERALREVYLAGFELAVREAQPWTVMSAYNGLGSSYCSESPRLLRQILRHEWGFDGLVMSDWGAVQNRASAFAAGLDLEMPGVAGLTGPEVRAALKAGTLREADVRRAASEVLRLGQRVAARGPATNFDVQEADALAREAAEQGCVLLQNAGDVLPLARGQKLAVVGAFASKPRYQGAGSSHLNPREQTTPHDELCREFGAENVSYAAGYRRYPSEPDATQPDAMQPDAGLIAEAVAAARAADITVAFVGLPETFEVEGIDRRHLELPDSHNALVEALLEVTDKLVVVLQGGAPMRLPWRAQVPAVLCAYLGGQAGASAVARILSGAANPCGKLAETWADNLSHYPSSAYFPTHNQRKGGPRTVQYRESLLVGYRYFERVGLRPAFPFGHGLSYTRFAIEKVEPLGQRLRVCIRNTGQRRGAEVVQVYVQRPQETSAVLREGLKLAAFDRVELEAGEATWLTLELPARTWQHYDPFWGRWRTEGGEWRVLVGTSSRNIHAEYTVQVAGETLPHSLPTAYRFPSVPFLASEASFAALYGSSLPSAPSWQRGNYSANTPLEDLQGHTLGRVLLSGMVLGQRGQIDETGASLSSKRALQQMPLRSITMQAGPTANMGLVRLLAALMNRHAFATAKAAVQTVRRSFAKWSS